MTPSEIDTRLLAAIRAEVGGPMVAKDTLRAVKDTLADLGLMIVPGWRPIESAPNHTHKERILVVGGAWPKPELVLPDGDWWRLRIKQGAKGPPTHWAPLLTPPAALSAEPFETGEVA
ncbi:hypothetical protein [Novosphingobium sp. M1R2S20]|uniref:DUF551 domain-containing protein n=1 Tax=Novosphingobium rhizovicinum TaxID=3228928 RepID=A0ABV3RD50_9SPHN